MLRTIFLISFIVNLINVFGQENWDKHLSPVVERSAVFPNWKGLATADACVIRQNDTLKMWYVGSGWLNASDDCPHVRIGYAWSLNGIDWNEFEENPVLDLGSDSTDFDFDGTETPTVIYDQTAPVNERYKMWYGGRNSRCMPINDHKLGYATSPNGIEWTKYEGNPVFQAGPAESWFNSFVSSPCVVKIGDIYQMWFTAPDLILNGQPTDGHGNIGYATSIDGINWELFDEPVLIAGAEDNWDSASCAEPSVVYFDNHYYMFYSALDQWEIENFQVGFAKSTDGINWTKSALNPVLTIGESGTWDYYWASHSTVLYNSTAGRFEMWYTGRDTDTIESLDGYFWDIGFASTPVLLKMNESNIHENLPYPNPCPDFLTIPVSAPVDRIVIQNLTGSMVKELNYSNYDTHIVVDLTEFSQGEYLISLLNWSGMPFQQIKIVRH